MQLRWTEAASADLERIADYLSVHAPSRAAGLAMSIYEAPELLLSFPHRGRTGRRPARGSCCLRLCRGSWSTRFAKTRSTSFASCMVRSGGPERARDDDGRRGDSTRMPSRSTSPSCSSRSLPTNADRSILALAIVIASLCVSFRQKELTGRCTMALDAVYAAGLTEFPPRPGTLTPADSSYEEIVREVAFAAMVERGLVDAREGRVSTHDEMRHAIESWRK